MALHPKLIEQARQDILDRFRRDNARPGHVLNAKAFIIYPHRDELMEALRQLQTNGWVDEREALTELGFQNLY